MAEKVNKEKQPDNANVEGAGQLHGLYPTRARVLIRSDHDAVRFEMKSSVLRTESSHISISTVSGNVPISKNKRDSFLSYSLST